MSNEKKPKNFNDLSQLSNLFSKEELDEKKFKEIEEAYRTLSDPEKKRLVDAGVDPNSQNQGHNWNQGPFEFHFGSDNIHDIFNQFGFGFNQRPMRRNKSLNITNVLSS